MRSSCTSVRRSSSGCSRLERDGSILRSSNNYNTLWSICMFDCRNGVFCMLVVPLCKECSPTFTRCPSHENQGVFLQWVGTSCCTRWIYRRRRITRCEHLCECHRRWTFAVAELGHRKYFTCTYANARTDAAEPNR